ncbi:MAG: 4-hydroxyphenylpyruvate dioxygenase [Bacteroidota bacterium]|nr:4-hydroxyphenylpyruvate dioxygenase [Bacteroidota bacterium]
METLEKAPQKTMADDFLPLLGTDYLELYVGNAKQAAYYYQAAWGFQPLAYSGLETGNREQVSYVVRQGKITIMLTTPLNSKNPINDHLRKHGDGVKAYAITVDDATLSYKETTDRGGISYLEPTTYQDENGKVVVSGIRTYGDVVNLFVERSEYDGVFLPGFKAWNPVFRAPESGIKHVDHAVGNVELGKMNEWVSYYERVMGFYNLITFDDKDISTEYSALMSKVVSNGNGYIKFPINEPAEGKKKSQIEEYLDFYEGPGVQHLALATEDIIATVKNLKARGIEFLTVPSSYYQELYDRVGLIDEDIKAIEELNILVDRDEEGYLLQIFSKPLEDRPTLFIEVIQRKGATSFGKGNFKALFESIEREQELRGNL